MVDARMAEGFTSGASQALQYHLSQPERQARLAEAKSRQQLSELKLQQAQQLAPLQEERAELELQKLQAENRKMRSSLMRDSTYRAFDRFEGDGDVRHINTFLQEAHKTPEGQNLHGNMLRVDKLDNKDLAASLLAKAGYADAQEMVNDPEVMDNFLIGTTPDGQQTLVDVSKLYAATGYTRYMDDRSLQQRMQQAALANALHGQRSADSSLIAQIAEEEGITTYEATKKYYQTKNAGRATGSQLERVTQQVMQENPGMSRAEAMDVAKRQTEGRTSAAKNVEDAEVVKDQLDSLGDGSFFSVDLSDPTARRQAGRYISQLEQFSGKKLSTEDRRVARDLRSLFELGKTAGEELSQEETGIIDNTLFRLKKYFSDNVEGVEGTSAYETFRNIFRNSLYGASLTATEVSAFEAAAGSLKQKLGPALQQLKTQVEDTRTQMQSIYDMNDEYLAYYYLGSSLEEVDQVIDALDQRLQYFQEYSVDNDVTVGEAKSADLKAMSKDSSGNQIPISDFMKNIKGLNN